MANSKSSYHFVPWARRGLSNFLPATLPSTANVRLRAELALKMDIAGTLGELVTQHSEVVSHTIELIGPGDIMGINPQVVVRTDPKPNSVDVEPNYLASIEFYDEDFPWRYTPLSTLSGKPNCLLPWLYLLVLEESEFELLNNSAAALPTLQIKMDDTKLKSVFPQPQDNWAWAHVHLNTATLADTSSMFPISTNGADIIPNATAIDNRLKQDPDLGISRLLCPRVLDANKKYQAFLIPAFESGRLAGLNQLINSGSVKLDQASWKFEDVVQQFPYYYSWNFSTGDATDFEDLISQLRPLPVNQEVGRRWVDIQHPGWGINEVTPNKVLLEGALLPPVNRAQVQPPNLLTNISDDFTKQVRKALNLTKDLQSQDPIISPPLYGNKYAKVQELNLDLPNFWLTTINRDPRNRIAAGFGSLVVQKNQEDLMNKAWEQLANLREVNELIDRNQFCRMVNDHLYRKRLQVRSLESLLRVSAQMHSKILGTGGTLRFQIKQSKIPLALFSAQFKKITRSGGLVQKRMSNVTAVANQLQEIAFLDAINSDRIKLFSKSKSDNLLNLAKIYTNVLASKPIVSNSKNAVNLNALLSSTGLSKTLIGKSVVSTSFNYKISKQISFSATATESTATQLKSQGTRFKKAILAFATVAERAQVSPAAKTSLDLAQLSGNLRTRLNPEINFQRQLQHILGEHSTEERILNAPKISQPMYEPLKEISTELLLPNIGLIEYNSITVMRNNQAFIEAYMLGVNQEFGKELLWRSYPTDQRGTYFHQFWNPTNNPDYDAEKAKDITDIHTWAINKNLGQNAPTGHATDQLVLIIKGELLKRYPNTIIYLQKSRWSESERRLILEPELDANGELIPGVIKEPVIKSALSESFQLIGFDISVETARGNQNANTGWFVVIKQAVGEPRFGIDQNQSSLNKNWDDLDYTDFKIKPTLLSPGNKPALGVLASVEVTKIPWGENAANMAYILYQRPYEIAILAREMIAP